MTLTQRVFLALLLGVITASLLNGPWAAWASVVAPALQLLGNLFLNALKMVALPLIGITLVSSMLGLAHTPGRLSRYAISFYLTSTLLAVSVGMLVANVLAPGLRANLSPDSLARLLGEQSAQLTLSPQADNPLVTGLQTLIPSNIVHAMADGNLVAIVLFALALGLALRTLPPSLRAVQQPFWDGLQQAMMTLTQWVLHVAPIGVFALVAHNLLHVGWEAVMPLMWLVLTVILGLVLHAVVSLGLVLRWVAATSPAAHGRAMAPALWMAFSTASSAATLPLTLRCLRERAGVSASVTGFTVPLGSALNMDGTALYECIAVLFLAQLLGADLSVMDQLIVIALALATSTGMAGIPAASLVAITLIIDRLGLPTAAVGLLLITDRPLDMCRTAVNVWSDSVAARVVARFESLP